MAASIDCLCSRVPYVAARVLNRLTLNGRVLTIDGLRSLIGVRNGAHLCTCHLRVRLHYYSLSFSSWGQECYLEIDEWLEILPLSLGFTKQDVLVIS